MFFQTYTFDKMFHTWTRGVSLWLRSTCINDKHKQTCVEKAWYIYIYLWHGLQHHIHNSSFSVLFPCISLLCHLLSLCCSFGFYGKCFSFSFHLLTEMEITAIQYQTAVHTMLMLAASRICGNTRKWEMAQFLKLDQFNGAVKMSLETVQVPLVCMPILMLGTRPMPDDWKLWFLFKAVTEDLGPWIFLAAASMNPGYFHRKQRENWTKKSYHFFFLATWNLSHSHVVCKIKFTGQFFLPGTTIWL